MICSYDIFIASSYLLCSLFASSRSIRNMSYTIYVCIYKKREQFKDNDNNNNNNNDDSGWWTHKNHSSRIKYYEMRMEWHIGIGIGVGIDFTCYFHPCKYFNFQYLHISLSFSLVHQPNEA